MTKDETIEPSLAESRSGEDEWRQRYFEARDALFQFKHPPDPRLLREIADEIDCGSDCEHGNTEWDTNAHVCSRSERKEGCAGEKASCLRQFADAIGIRSAAVDQTGGVTSPDYVMVPKQEFGSIIYDIENGFTETAMKQLEKLLSAAPPSPRSDEGSGMTPSKLEGFSAALRAQVIEECAKVVENFSQIGMWEAARTRVCIAKAIRSLSAVSASDVGEPVAWRWRDASVSEWVVWNREPTAEDFVPPNEIGRDVIVQPLYAAPPSPPPSVEVGEMVEWLQHRSTVFVERGMIDHHKKLIKAASLLIALDAERGRMRKLAQLVVDVHRDVERGEGIPREIYHAARDIIEPRSALPADEVDNG